MALIAEAEELEIGFLPKFLYSLCASRSTLPVFYHYIVFVPFEEYIFGIYLLEYLCFLRTAEELHTGEVKSLLSNLSHDPAAGADSAPSTWSLRRISRVICMLPARGASDLARCFSCWYRLWPISRGISPFDIIFEAR